MIIQIRRDSKSNKRFRYKFEQSKEMYDFGNKYIDLEDVTDQKIVYRFSSEAIETIEEQIKSIKYFKTKTL